jgi:hypothetical protein
LYILIDEIISGGASSNNSWDKHFGAFSAILPPEEPMSHAGDAILITTQTKSAVNQRPYRDIVFYAKTGGIK